MYTARTWLRTRAIGYMAGRPTVHGRVHRPRRRVTAVYQPCTRPCIWPVHAVYMLVYTGRVHGRDVYTAPRVHAGTRLRTRAVTRPCTRYVDGRKRRCTRPCSGPCTRSVHSRVHRRCTRAVYTFSAVLTARTRPCKRPFTRPVRGGITAVYTSRARRVHGV